MGMLSDRSTSIGSSINNYLKGESQQEDHVIHLLFSANRWEAASRIRENIARGVSVIIDRYYYSGIVYSAAKNRKDLSLEWSRQPEIGLPRPDLCIFLDISPEEAAQRGGFGTERYETDEMQKKVRQLFYELRERVEHEEMVFVDAGASIKEVEQIMIGLATKLLKSKILDEPLRSLH